MTQPLSLLIVDDHQLVRWGIRTFLATQTDISVLGEAASGEEALQLAAELQPQVVLMDLRMPGMGGVEAIKHIHQRWPEMAVVVLTTYNEDDLMIQGLQAGACGYLLKDCSLETLVQAIRAAARGEMLVPPEVMARILARAAQAGAPMRAAPRGPLDLTEREREVLAGVARGERSKEIAVHLGISERTVGSYLNNVFTKLGVDSRASAVAVAMERGLLPRLD
ncbi:MAG TPA: response regulator transcription factor [Ktedonobacterales bacterium]|nr:response regulator transcription factor [Ktedonobacterales bacterium]